MAHISKSDKNFILINVFTVAPRNQDKLVDLLIDATEQTMRHLPGFVSASIHKSIDGGRVVNYAQWRSKEDFDSMRIDETAARHMQTVTAMASFDPIVCEVADSIGA